MSWRRSWALCRHELRALSDDPGVIVFLLVMPLMMMFVMKPLFALALQSEGFFGASGAEQAVPGMAAMFAAFSVGFAGFTFFREHGWSTWDRLRASPATTGDIMVGKLAPTLLIAIAQMATLFLFGVLLLDLRIAGSVLGLGLMIVIYSACLLAFAMAITALSRTSLQLNTFANLGAMVFAVFGGALVPMTVLPEWVATVARFTPTFWAMEGFLGVVLHGDDVSATLLPVVILVAFGVAFTAVAILRFRVEETKVYYG